MKEMGYRALALTDHETIAGCARLKKAADEAKKAAEEAKKEAVK